MKIEFSVEGGLAHFPRLRKPVTIDAATLPPAHGARLRKLVDNARFFDATPAAAPAAARDAQCYTIAVEDGARRRTLQVSEPIADAPMRDLVNELVACADDARRAHPGTA
ncbi:MAG TPA: protealysin inhibitor emfourin [Casimicrobiaceae bacterium]